MTVPIFAAKLVPPQDKQPHFKKFKLVLPLFLQISYLLENSNHHKDLLYKSQNFHHQRQTCMFFLPHTYIL